MRVVDVKLRVPGPITTLYWGLSRSIFGSNICVFLILAFLTPILYFVIESAAPHKGPILCVLEVITCPPLEPALLFC